MIRLIDHSDTHLLQKVIFPKGVAYQVVPKSSIGDSTAVQRFSYLSEARKAAHIPYSPPKAAKA
jgi:hypothetical protein